MNDAPFGSALEALRFAFTFALGAKPNRDAVNQLSSPTKSTGRGLGGMDGAAQAGMVLSKLHECGPLPENLLIAKVAPRSIPCSCGAPCCSKARPNLQWSQAHGYVTDYCLVTVRKSSTGTRGLMFNYQLNAALVLKYLGSHQSIKEISEGAEVSLQTAHSHKKILFSLLKSKESEAWQNIEQRLIVAGITNPIN